LDVLEEVPAGADLHAAEQRWLDKLRPFDPEIGYNTHTSATGPNGVRRSAETKRRLSAAGKGKPFTAERCANISKARKESARAYAAVCEANARKRVFSPPLVRKILKMRQDGLAVQKIADAMGVSRRAIRAILEGDSYVDLTGIQKER
jgi:response regulator of citrate/malate metabolism